MEMDLFESVSYYLKYYTGFILCYFFQLQRFAD